MINFINKKLIRLKNSSKVLKLIYFYHYLFHDKKLGNIGFNFSKKKTRKELVQNIIVKKNYKKYLEIGCFDDELFNHINCLKKVGVDPMSGGTIRMTSDQFFSNNKEFFDCVFIDGLHEYHQVRKDISNSIKFLNDGGIILLHDCLPNNYYEQATPRCQWTWNGDVWKAIVESRTYEDVDTYTCVADHGLGIIFKRNNKNLLKLNNINFKNLKFSDYYNYHNEYMNLIDSDELNKIFIN